jgi:hypothetical protein
MSIDIQPDEVASILKTQLSNLNTGSETYEVGSV